MTREGTTGHPGGGGGYVNAGGGRGRVTWCNVVGVVCRTVTLKRTAAAKEARKSYVRGHS